MALFFTSIFIFIILILLKGFYSFTVGDMMITINVLYRNGNAMNVFTFNPDKSTITFESTYKVEELEVFSAYSMSNAINMAKLYQTMIHYGYHKYETLELMGCTSIKNMLGANYHNTKTKIKRNIGKNFSHISALL